MQAFAESNFAWLRIDRIKSRLRLFRARAVCAAYTSSPRGAHPCGAFCLIGISYQTKKDTPASQERPEHFYQKLEIQV